MFNSKKMTKAVILIVLLTLNAEVKEQGTVGKNMLRIKAALKLASSLLSIRFKRIWIQDYSREEFKSSIWTPIKQVLESIGAKYLQPLLSVKPKTVLSLRSRFAVMNTTSLLLFCLMRMENIIKGYFSKDHLRSFCLRQNKPPKYPVCA